MMVKWVSYWERTVISKKGKYMWTKFCKLWEDRTHAKITSNFPYHYIQLFGLHKDMIQNSKSNLKWMSVTHLFLHLHWANMRRLCYSQASPRKFGINYQISQTRLNIAKTYEKIFNMTITDRPLHGNYSKCVSLICIYLYLYEENFQMFIQIIFFSKTKERYRPNVLHYQVLVRETPTHVQALHGI